MPSSNLAGDVSSVSLGELQVAYPAAGLRLYAECQVLRQKTSTIDEALHEKLSLLVGLGSTGLKTGLQELSSAIESSIKYADIWQQLPLRPLFSTNHKAHTLPGFSVTLQVTDSHLLPPHPKHETKINSIHLALLYSATAYQSSDRYASARSEDDDMLDPGSPPVPTTDQSCLPAAISLLDLALQTFISGKRGRGGTKGLVLESRNLRHSLADLIPRSFKPGHSTSLIDRTHYVAGIIRTLCSIRKRAISRDLNDAFDALQVHDNGNGVLQSSLERKLFHLVEKGLGDSAAAERLKPVRLRFAPEVTLSEEMGVETNEEFTSLFETGSVASQANGERENEDGSSGGGIRSSGDWCQDEPFDSLFDDDSALQMDHLGEDVYELLLDSDGVMLDEDTEVDADHGDENDAWEGCERDDDKYVHALECAMLF